MTGADESTAAKLARKISASEITVGPKDKIRLVVTDLKPVRPRSGWHYLTVRVADHNGEPSRTPLMTGIVSGGGRGVMPWVEGRLYPEVEMHSGDRLDAREQGIEALLVKLLGQLIPPGGHIMIEYESPGQGETHAALLVQVPPAATYLGSIMFDAGFRGDFKDWYISEGGHEGPRKLQANKSPNADAARAAMRHHVADLRSFLKRPLPTDKANAAIVSRARERARKILKAARAKRS